MFKDTQTHTHTQAHAHLIKEVDIAEIESVFFKVQMND
jgi:hypothetical protein